VFGVWVDRNDIALPSYRIIKIRDTYNLKHGANIVVKVWATKSAALWDAIHCESQMLQNLEYQLKEEKEMEEKEKASHKKDKKRPNKK
jgi:ABC-type Fe2+-enterobactin transport system substrate-binding protein